MKYTPLVAILVVTVVAAGVLWYTMDTESVEENVACTLDAKICPDGTAVGREGPNCEFAACPDIAEDTRVTVQFGEPFEAFGETFTIDSLLEDSRCPLDVQCIQAGTIRVSGTSRTQMGTGQILFQLGQVSTTETLSLLLSAAEPAPKSTATIQKSSYRFTLQISRR